MRREMMADGGPFHAQTNDAWIGVDTNPPVPCGLSLRQWYAGMAMQAILVTENLPGLLDFKGESDLEGVSWEGAAKYAFRVAGHMLTEGDKP